MAVRIINQNVHDICGNPVPRNSLQMTTAVRAYMPRRQHDVVPYDQYVNVVRTY